MPWLWKTFWQEALSLARFCCRHPCTAPSSPSCLRQKRDGEIGHKHGDTRVGTLRKIYGMGFAAGYPPTEKLSGVLGQLNETALGQLRRDYETGHIEHKIAKAMK